MRPSVSAVRGSPRSLYVHYPFCLRRCHYCDFAVTRASDPPGRDWLDAVDADLARWFADETWESPVHLETLFVGGGTPSLLGPEGMIRLASLLRSRFDWLPDEIEWTAESNPASLDAAMAESWRATGVNRLSIGVQSFDDRVLEWLGRLHDSETAAAALAVIQAAGFESVNLDLMFGLPDGIVRDWRSEVGNAVDGGATHVSACGLTAEGGTRLGHRVDTGAVRMTGEDQYAEEYLAAAEELVRAGFVHYEVSNFALPGHESRHNWHYWDGSDYLGVGPSAHSFIGGVRVWNVSRWEAYRRALTEGDSPRAGSEVTGAGESQLERLWLAFRTNRGLPDADPLADTLKRIAGDLLARWHEAGWLETGGATTLTATGWLRMDEMVAGLGSRLGGTATHGPV